MSGIGSKKILRELFVIAIEGELVTVGGEQELLLETLDSDQHSFYTIPSVYATDNIVTDVWQTPGISAGLVAGGTHASLLKRRRFALPRAIDVILSVSCPFPGLHLRYEVYRIAGLD